MSLKPRRRESEASQNGGNCFALPGVSVFGVTSIAGAEEGEGESALLAGCAANVICVFESVEYNNPYYNMFCSVEGQAWKSLGGTTLRSATNRCGNKTNWIRTNGTVVACMNPGGNRPNPGNFNEVYVPVQYGAFC